MQTPLKVLAEHGITHTPWAGKETLTTREGLRQWKYRTSFLTKQAVSALAWLVVEGWDVFVVARADTVAVSITEPRPGEGV